MYDAWVLWEGHGMVCMLLTRCTGMCMPVLNILDVQTWESGGVPGLGLTDGDIGLLRGEDCDILTQGFNRIDRILIPPR
jgi:hypothetical protein